MPPGTGRTALALTGKGSYTGPNPGGDGSRLTTAIKHQAKIIPRNVPLAEQVKTELLSLIRLGDLSEHAGRLPAETHLSRQFGVSRATIRAALSALEQAGVVTRLHGVGTFVNDLGLPASTIWGWFDKAPEFADLIRNSGHAPDCQLLGSETVEAGHLAAPLRVDPVDKILLTYKRFLSDEEPVIYSITSVPVELIAPDRREAAMMPQACAESVYRFLQIQCDSRVNHQTSEIQVTLADQSVAAHLACTVGQPLFNVVEVGYSPQQEPLFHAVNFFRGDLVRFRLIRRPVLSIADF